MENTQMKPAEMLEQVNKAIAAVWWAASHTRSAAGP